jgi:hypothetical protein
VVRSSYSRSPRTVLTGAVVAGGLAAVVVGLALTGSTAVAQQSGEASTAYGISASVTDSLKATPSVSSDGAVKSDSAGSVASPAGFVHASSLSVSAGAGTATATVGSVTIGGKTISNISAKCTDGVATPGRTGTEKLTDTLTVTYGTVSGGKATGATITLLGAGDKVAETVSVAVVSCDKGTPPPPTSAPPTTSVPPTTAPPTGQPTGQPTGGPVPTGGTNPTKTPDQQAPNPSPVNGHGPVTG